MIRGFERARDGVRDKLRPLGRVSAAERREKTGGRKNRVLHINNGRAGDSRTSGRLGGPRVSEERAISHPFVDVDGSVDGGKWGSVP